MDAHKISEMNFIFKFEIIRTNQIILADPHGAPSPFFSSFLIVSSVSACFFLYKIFKSSSSLFFLSKICKKDAQCFSLQN